MESIINLYDELIASFPDIERKGKTMPYTSVNGHMFSFISKEGKMGLRLSDEDKNEIMTKYSTQLMVQHGRTMKDFVEVPTELLHEFPEIKIYLQKSFDYTLTLKPK